MITILAGFVKLGKRLIVVIWPLNHRRYGAVLHHTYLAAKTPGIYFTECDLKERFSETACVEFAIGM